MKLTLKDKFYWPAIQIINFAKSSHVNYFFTWALVLVIIMACSVFSIHQQLIGNAEQYRWYAAIPIVLFFYAAYGNAQWISWRYRMNDEAEQIMKRLVGGLPFSVTSDDHSSGWHGGGGSSN